MFEPYAEVLYLPGRDTTAETVRDAGAIITRTRTICNRQLLEGSAVKVIASATIGFDHIDTAWAEANGIVWKNAPGCNSSSVMQYMASVLVTLARKKGFRLEGKTLGVVGVGNVGSKLAALARILGMELLLCDPPRARAEGQQGYVSLEELVRGSDIISCHVPLTREGEDRTFHLFDRTLIDSMGPGQYLVNSSRGPVVDNEALASALRTGRIGGAILDVWEREPEPDPELIALADIATPHIAGYSADGKANGTRESVRTVARVLGLPLEDWQPRGLPDPAYGRLVFSIDAAGKTREEILSEAILHTYDVTRDDRALRQNPEMFEKLRGDYPIRREFSAYTVCAENAPADALDALEALGFKLKSMR